MSAKITKITGSVEIKDPNQKSQSVPVKIGTIVNDGQLLIIGKNSSIEFTCGNGIAGSKTTAGSYGLHDICPNSPPDR
ncbi:hypothetical protein [uncultured Nostoc sp.]|uniref:hypothetical protein n=1 Tax=uncultured Nostoc sp. TaxID=340711 RepID=UPI0035C9C78E